MSSLKTYTESEVEELRLTYRNQAVAAVKQAELKGFESGVSESVKQQALINSELKKWKAIAFALGGYQEESSDLKDIITTNAEKRNSKLLIQYIMEQVYKHTSSSLEKGNPEMIPLLKVIFEFCLRLFR